jgi:hypothetical protein
MRIERRAREGFVPGVVAFHQVAGDPIVNGAVKNRVGQRRIVSSSTHVQQANQYPQRTDGQHRSV